MEFQKLKYTRPSVLCVSLELEQGIATSSATVTPTGSKPYSPEVEEYIYDDNQRTNGLF